ncbi:hypothetical protein ACSTJF_00240, partial [Vibrio parahaemolyticus]
MSDSVFPDWKVIPPTFHIGKSKSHRQSGFEPMAAFAAQPTTSESHLVDRRITVMAGSVVVA